MENSGTFWNEDNKEITDIDWYFDAVSGSWKKITDSSLDDEKVQRLEADEKLQRLEFLEKNRMLYSKTEQEKILNILFRKNFKSDKEGYYNLNPSSRIDLFLESNLGPDIKKIIFTSLKKGEINRVVKKLSDLEEAKFILGSLDSSSLKSLTKLKKLNINRSEIQEPLSLESPTQLKELIFTSKTQDEDLSFLESLTQLEDLMLFNRGLDLSLLENLTSLKKIILQRQYFTEDKIAQLEGIFQATNPKVNIILRKD